MVAENAEPRLGQAGKEPSHQFQRQAMILTDGPRMVLTPTYHAFALYRPFQGATALPLALHSPAYGSLRAVDGSAARGADGTLHLALVNLDPRTPMDVSLALPGWHGQRVSGQVLTVSGGGVQELD